MASTRPGRVGNTIEDLASPSGKQLAHGGLTILLGFMTITMVMVESLRRKQVIPSPVAGLNYRPITVNFATRHAVKLREVAPTI